MSFEYTETYRSGHNGADSKSVREQSPASSNLAVSAKKSRCTVVHLFFLYNARFEKGNAKHRNSPVDCFGARVRADERRSEAGESRRLRQKKQVHCCAPVFYKMRDSKRAMQSIETVRWTVSVPGCVPTSAEARRANLAVSAKKSRCTIVRLFFYNVGIEKGKLNLDYFI